MEALSYLVAINEDIFPRSNILRGEFPCRCHIGGDTQLIVTEDNVILSGIIKLYP
jgi:hypothetical protein